MSTTSPEPSATAGTATQKAVSRRAVTALQAALAAEHAACYGYGVVGAYLSGNAAARAASDWVAHQVARNRLAAIISAAGVGPVAPAVAYELPVSVDSAARARQLAVLLEVRTEQAYLGLVGLTDLTLRAFGTGQLRAAALRAAAWRGVTVAFPGLSVNTQRGGKSASASSQSG